MAICTSTNAMPGHGEWPLRATQLGFGVKGGLLKVLRALRRARRVRRNWKLPGQRNEGRPATKIDWRRRSATYFASLKRSLPLRNRNFQRRS